eukprot:403341054
MLFAASFISVAQAGLKNWPLELRGTDAKTMDDIKSFSQSSDGGNGKAAVFANFYQFNCGVCFHDYPVWNKAVDEIVELYGDQVAFLKIDVRQSKGLQRFYGIDHTPFISFLGQGANNQGWNEFDGPARSVKDYKAWMIEQINTHTTGLSQIKKSLVQTNEQILTQSECDCNSGCSCEATEDSLTQRKPSLRLAQCGCQCGSSCQCGANCECGNEYIRASDYGGCSCKKHRSLAQTGAQAEVNTGYGGSCKCSRSSSSSSSFIKRMCQDQCECDRSNIS